jgi:opacity protein-like surface antigen
MRFVLIGIISLLFFSSKAQVKEVHFLGKNWYLHGYDLRVKGRLYTPSFYNNLFENAEFPTSEYKDHFDFHAYIPKRDYLRAVNTVSAGAVFRPFFQSPINFIRQIEFAHNVELERISLKLDKYQSPQNQYSTFIKTLEFGYNPRLILSSPTIAGSLKFYLAADGYGFIPIIGTIYTRPNEAFLPNGSKSYDIAGTFYNDRISTKHLKYGGGFSAGVKINLSCNWNFHVEYSSFDVYTRHSSTKSTSQNGNRGVQLGLRYKYGSPEDTENKNEGSTPVFW